jgi:rhodanese-related sulfurtransferase
MNFFWWLPFGKVPEIDTHELHARLQDRPAPQIIDVRTESEWNSGHIAGTINVPVTELKARVKSLPLDKQRPVIALCRSARRSILAVRILRAHGFDACQLQKGMLAWRDAGLPVEGNMENLA